MKLVQNVLLILFLIQIINVNTFADIEIQSSINDNVWNSVKSITPLKGDVVKLKVEKKEKTNRRETFQYL